MGEEKLRTVDYLFVVEFLAPETFSSDMFEFPGATAPLIQFPAPPIKIDAAAGITALLLQHMIDGDPVFKSGMGLLDTSEYILSFVVINLSSNYPDIFGQ